MYIRYNGKKYDGIRSLNFSPQTDIIGNELPINEFSAEIKTGDNITIGKYAFLYGDDGALWAKYWIIEAQRLSPQTITIKCQSDILILSRKTLTARMCDKTSAFALISECFSAFGLGFTISSALIDKEITGYLPEQTARERLQWVCFVIGAYVKTFFNDKTEILAIDESVHYIQPSRTFYRPKLSYRDYVTAVSATAYTYTQGTPSSTDKWVQVGNDYYIETTRQASLNNSNVPSGTPGNVIDLSGITIINPGNISEILTRLSEEYFNRRQLTADILDSGEVQPADKITIFDGVNTLITGYVKSAEFTFGKAQRASLTLTQTLPANAARLTIIYHYGGEIIERETYFFPANTDYSLQNSYIDKTAQGRRRIYLPLTETTQGTTGSAASTADVECDVALEFKDNELEIISVDSANLSRGVLTIG